MEIIAKVIIIAIKYLTYYSKDIKSDFSAFVKKSTFKLTWSKTRENFVFVQLFIIEIKMWKFIVLYVI